MRLRTRQHVGLLALALINTVPALEVEQAWSILAIATAAAVVSYFLSRPQGGSSVPTWVIYTGVFLASCYLIFEMFFPHEEQTVYILDLSHFMILLACCKFFELRTYRDAALIVIISFLLLVISAFASASSVFGLVLILDVTFGLAWVMAFQARREIDLMVARRPAVMRAGPATAIMPEQEEVRGAGYTRAALVHCTALLLLGAAVFVVIPRGWGRGIFGRIQSVIPQAVTGFSNEVDLDDGQLMEDQTPVMRVSASTRGRPIQPDEFSPYMRGATFERYVEGRWQPPRKLQKSIDMKRESKVAPINQLALLQPADRIIEQEIWLENLGAGTLFSIYPPLAFGSHDIDQILVNKVDLTLQTQERIKGGVRYTVRSARSVSATTASMLDTLEPTQPPRGRGSIIDPAVRTRAQALLGQWGDPSDPTQWASLTKRLCDHFSASGEYQYTLNRGARRRDIDPIRDFLFENKRGHCEYFATAMTLMCQAVEIPARLVNGYYGGEYNIVGGFYQFRQKDAHAWVEVYLPKRGWVMYDPSPPAGVTSDVMPDGVLANLERFLDYLQFKWSTIVVAFDSESRYDLVEQFQVWLYEMQHSDGARTSFGSMVLAFLWGPELLPLWQRMFYWLLLALCLVLLILLLRVLAIFSLLARERIPLVRRRRGRSVRPAEARFYDRLTMLLATKGHVRPANATPREFALQLAASQDDFSAMPEFIEWFYEAQYARRAPGRERMTRIGEFLQRLREDPAFGARRRY